MLSEFSQQLGNLLDSFKVSIGVQFSEGGNDWLRVNFDGSTFNKASWEVFSFNLLRTASYLNFN